MSTIPKLALLPSGYKASKVYSVLPTDGVGDFDFSRSGQATRINKNGLIETVGSNVPRLNYSMIDGVVSGCPSLLLEPQRTNNVLYSQEVDNAWWLKFNCVITPNTSISPDGTLNADTLTASSSSSSSSVVYRTGVTCGSLSFFAKDIDLSIGKFKISVDGVGSASWDKNGNLVSVSGGTASNGVYYGNGWFRFSYNVTSGSVVNYGIESGSGNESILVFGLQNEPSASYPTSYIPTQGSQVTRVAETCNGAGDANTFNDSEGVLFAEISALTDDGITRGITISNGTSNERVQLFYFGLNQISSNVISGGVGQGLLGSSVNILNGNKFALKYKLNDLSLWSNGFKVALDTIATMPNGLNTLSFDNGVGASNFYGNTKQLQYFDSALNDTELETLTSWKSFREMATSQLYTIQ